VARDSRQQRAGFTLVELMVVLAMMGVLAVMAVGYMREHINATQGMEALAMVQSFRAAEESYRASESVYMDVSQNGWFPRDPAGQEGPKKRSFYDAPGSGHSDNPNWRIFNPTVPGPVRCGYLVNAGVAGQAMTAPATTEISNGWPTPGEPWFVLQAKCDLDGDGEPSYYLASSINTEVYIHNDGE
jgi:prepilin-type N-terminal cleavage/methylation domain-containing protein